ncbi:MAG TPA: hypothetical protein VKU94_07650, partial [Geobacterales bacterium]|nr:hypothetical protein [Geobacterales bacterium]
KLDFIKRDNFHSGAGYGGIDTDRLVTTMEVYNEELAINSTAIFTFELFIMGRIKSFEAIYYHKTIRSAQLLLLRGIEEAFKEFGFMEKFDVDSYLALDDYTTWVEVSRSKEGSHFLERLAKRDLLKSAFEKKFIMKSKKDEMMKILSEAKSEIAKLTDMNEDMIYLDLSILPSVPYHNSYIKDPFEIPVFDSKTGKVSKFSEISPWIETLKGYLNILRVYTDKDKRDRVSLACQKVFNRLSI